MKFPRQTRALRMPLLLLPLLLGALTDCAPPPLEEPTLGTETFETSGAGTMLARRLEGVWELSTSSLKTDCPMEPVISPMQGRTEWLARDSEVFIERLEQGGGLLEFWAVDEDTLRASHSIEMYDCEVTQDLTISIETFNRRYIKATFVAELYHNEVTVCEVAAAAYDLPDSCEVTIEWEGSRLYR